VDKLAIRFTYSSNGHGIYCADMETGKEGPLEAYPTPQELWNLTFAKASAWRDRFADVPFEDRGGFYQGRYYQDIAIDRVLQAIAAGQPRILLQPSNSSICCEFLSHLESILAKVYQNKPLQP